MSKAKHTPGPWHRFEENNCEVIAVATHGETGFREIATAYEGNGALIEAAPDLLAALKVMVERAIPFAAHWKDDQAIVAAHAAIAKAEGTS